MLERLTQKSQWKSAQAVKPKTALPNSIWIIPDAMDKTYATQRAGIMRGHHSNQITIVRKQFFSLPRQHQ